MRKQNNKPMNQVTKAVANYSVPSASYSNVPGAFLTIPEDGWYDLSFSCYVQSGRNGVYSFGRIRLVLNSVYIPRTERWFYEENDSATYSLFQTSAHLSKLVYCKAGDEFVVQAIEDDPDFSINNCFIEYKQVKK